jgi:DNA-binding transcriptional ArsR family regulator
MRQPPAQSSLRYPLNILGSRANIRTLRELCAHGGDLSVTHLAAASRLTTQGVRNALAELHSARIVETIGSGRTVLYRLSRANPLAGALEALFRAEADRAAAVTSSVKAAVARPEVVAAWFYGSFARGEDRYGSDVDIAVIVEASDQDAIAEAIRGQLRQDGDRLGFSPSLVSIGMDDVRRLSAGDPWWVRLEAEAVPIKGRRPAELAAMARRRP